MAFILNKWEHYNKKEFLALIISIHRVFIVYIYNIYIHRFLYTLYIYCPQFQVVDGSAVLLMSRSDVLTGLGLKLGPALKLYRQVRILQTRLPNPPLPCWTHLKPSIREFTSFFFVLKYTYCTISDVITSVLLLKSPYLWCYYLSSAIKVTLSLMLLPQFCY